MKGLCRVGSALVLVIVLSFTASGSAEVRMQHSGTIVSIARDGRTFVLAEVGPWHGATVITYRRITLAPETELAIVRFGEPLEEILTEAEAFAADLIAVMTTCRSGVKRGLLGSVAEQVVKRATPSVLLLRPALG